MALPLLHRPSTILLSKTQFPAPDAIFAQHLKKGPAMYTIHFTFEEKDKAPKTVSSPPGDTLLEVGLKNDIHLHHNCGGVCACSTCHIYLEKGEDYVDEITDKEEDFVDRARNPKLSSRLACQCLLDDGDGDVEVMIPDQSVILGE